jgi:hypothetical protein
MEEMMETGRKGRRKERYIYNSSITFFLLMFHEVKMMVHLYTVNRKGLLFDTQDVLLIWGNENVRPILTLN